jgi:hypothetical protein
LYWPPESGQVRKARSQNLVTLDQALQGMAEARDVEQSRESHGTMYIIRKKT